MSSAIPEFPHAVITRDDRGVYTLRIDDAKSLNILSTPVIVGLTRAATWLASQPDVRVVILRGTGERAFVAGANIHEMAGLTPGDAFVHIDKIRRLCDAVRAIPVPTIARVPGYCLGAGMELAAACDIRLGSPEAVIGMPEVRVGIPSVVHAALLPALIGPGATNWMLLTGENVDASQGLAWGFFQFVSGEEGLDALVEKSVSPIVASGPRAVRSQKALLQYWEDATLQGGVDHSMVHFSEAFTTDEPGTYMAPFVNRKRS